MKKRDFEEFEAVCLLYSMCYHLNELIGDIKSELPEELKIDLFHPWLDDLVHDMENYVDNKRDVFNSVCMEENDDNEDKV